MADKNRNYRKVEGMLYNYKTIKAEIKNIDLEIEDIRSEYSGCTAIGYEEKSSPTYKFNSSVENEVVNREKQIKYFENLRNSKQRLVDKIDNALETLTFRELDIVHLRYFNKISNQEVAKQIDLTEQRVCEIKSNVINRLIDLLILNKY